MLQAHKEIVKQLVELISITSIMEVKLFIIIFIPFATYLEPERKSYNIMLPSLNYCRCFDGRIVTVVISNKKSLYQKLVIILQVLIRLMGADETIHAVHDDSLHWLAETDLLEMLVDKLGPPVS